MTREPAQGGALPIGLLLVGASVAAYLAPPPGAFEPLYPGQTLWVGTALLQAVLAAGLWLRLPGAWAAALVAFVVHWVFLGLLALLLFLFRVLPWEGGGPLPGNSFNPLLLGTLAAFSMGAGLVYKVAISSMLNARRSGS